MPLINFSGIASGIDSEALIKATSDATRTYRVLPKQNKIATLEDTNTSLQTLDTKLTSLQTLLKPYMSAFGGPLSKKATSSDETKVSALATTGATNGSYEVTVSALAKNATLSLKSGTTYTSSSDPIGSGITDATPDGDRTVSITIGSGGSAQTVDVVLTSATTLAEFASTFNDSTTKAVATVVNIGGATADYRIVITSNNQGEDEGSLTIDASALEISGNNIFNDNLLDQAENAIFQISGIGDSGGPADIERSTNTISDVIPGVTFNLLEVETTNPITITVADDVAGTIQKVQSFVDSFNEIIEYLAEQNKVERSESGESVTNTFSPLATTRIDEGVVQQIRSAISASSYKVTDSGGGILNEVTIFADLGITTERDGTLKFDSAKLTEALSKEPTSANEILKNFGDMVASTANDDDSSTNGIIDRYVRFNGIIDLAETGNENQIKSLNEQISVAEAFILRQEESMRKRFTSLEKTIGQLTSQQAALTSALAGLGA